MLKERLWSDDTMERSSPQGAPSTHFSIHPLCRALTDAVGYRGNCILGSSIDRHSSVKIAKVRYEGTLVWHLSLRKPSRYPCMLAWERTGRAHYPGTCLVSQIYPCLLLIVSCWSSPVPGYRRSRAIVEAWFRDPGLSLCAPCGYRNLAMRLTELLPGHASNPEGRTRPHNRVAALQQGFSRGCANA